MITNKQIRILRSEALAVGDYDQAAICDLALNGEIDVDAYTVLSPKWDKALRAMSQDDALANCVAAIEGKAQ